MPLFKCTVRSPETYDVLGWLVTAAVTVEEASDNAERWAMGQIGLVSEIYEVDQPGAQAAEGYLMFVRAST